MVHSRVCWECRVQGGQGGNGRFTRGGRRGCCMEQAYPYLLSIPPPTYVEPDAHFHGWSAVHWISFSSSWPDTLHQSMWAERSGQIFRLSLSSIYGSPAHRSVLAHLTFWPAPLRSKAGLKVGALGLRSSHQPGPPTTPADFFHFSQRDSYFPIGIGLYW